VREGSEQYRGDVPASYDKFLGPVLFADYAAQMARRVTELAPGRVLETAAGTGFVTAALSSALPPDVQLTATDLNDDMLNVARERVRGTVVMQTADATSLPYGAAAFDAVVCQFGIMFYPDLRRGFAEAHRVLRPGGHYLFSVWDSHAFNPFARVADEVVCANFPDDPPPFYKVPFDLGAIDPVKNLLIEQRFGDIVIEVINQHPSVSSWADLASGIVYGGPLQAQIAARGTTDPEQIRLDVAAALEREFGPAPTTMPLQAIFYRAAAA
jgi:ubiquinone/menaquinone biosynthesis C-methylase UbiE